MKERVKQNVIYKTAYKHKLHKVKGKVVTVHTMKAYRGCLHRQSYFSDQQNVILQSAFFERKSVYIYFSAT